MSPPNRNLPNTHYLSLVTLNPHSSIPLYRQIYQALRDAIQNGRLAPNTKLPSTRDLATLWGVSRNTLRNAFDQLIAEEYLEAVVGRGTFVMPQAIRPSTHHSPSTSPRVRPLSEIGKALEPFGKSLHSSAAKGSAFSLGVPDVTAFPHKVWQRILNRCQRRMASRSETAVYVNGIWRLRQAIASYLVSARGLRCTPEQVDIVPGSISGMYLVALSLLNRGDTVWMENPGYINANGLLRYRGAKVIPISVDEAGLNVADGVAQAPDARLAYVTPSHQYPLGVTMSLNRRNQLLDWAAQNYAWILEDDYDSEFRYDGPPISALQGLDNDQRVIYCGTFSKIMMPSLRLGYVVLPPDLVDVYTGVKMPLALYSAVLIQEAVAEFMLEGHFVRHIRQMRKHYEARRDALVKSIERHLAGAVTLGPTNCGIHLVGYLADGLEETAVLHKAHQLGMALTPLSTQYFGGQPKSGLIFGFANVPPEEIEPYIAKLAAAL